jgi:hypothetical protein
MNTSNNVVTSVGSDSCRREVGVEELGSQRV